MAVIFKEIVKLQYQHVKVVTNVKNIGELKSVFVNHVEEKQKSDNNYLILQGYLKVVDPITISTILVHIEDEKVKENIIILGRNITRISLSEKLDVIASDKVKTIVELDTALKRENLPFFKRDYAIHSLSSEEVIKRKDLIVKWLRDNRIPCTFDSNSNEIIIAEKIRLNAPYEHITDYACPTRIILKRIKHIVDSTPSLFNQPTDVKQTDLEAKVDTRE